MRRELFNNLNDVINVPKKIPIITFKDHKYSCYEQIGEGIVFYNSDNVLECKYKIFDNRLINNLNINKSRYEFEIFKFSNGSIVSMIIKEKIIIYDEID